MKNSLPMSWITCEYGCSSRENQLQALNRKYLDDNSVMAEAEYRNIFGTVVKPKKTAQIKEDLIK